MRIKHLIILLFLCLGINAQETSVTGIVKNSIKGKVLLIDDILNNNVLGRDTLKADGKYSLAININRTSYYRLKFGNDQNSFFFLILNPGDKVTLNFDLNNPKIPYVEGSADTKLLYSTVKQLNDYEQQIKDMNKKLQEEKKQFLIQTLTANPGSLSSLYFIESLNMDSNFMVYEKVSAGLTKNYPNDPFVSDFSNKVESSKFLKPGSLAPDFTLPNPVGKNISLSDFRGKYVLIDFWASWCGPCRMASPELTKMYAKYNGKNFEILGVSLDKSGDAWIKAISDDKLLWPQVSDLKQWDSQAGRLYKVQSIPFTVLVDPNGNVIAKGLRGEELEKKLAELIK